MRWIKGFGMAAGAVMLAAALAGCGLLAGPEDRDFAKEATALGKSYDLVQQGAIAYLEHGNPSVSTAQDIETYDQQAASAVKDVLEEAKTASQPDPALVAAGASAAEVKQSKVDVFDGLLDMARQAIAKLKRAMP